MEESQSTDVMDVTEQFLNSFSSEIDDLPKRMPEPTPKNLHPQAALMFTKMAEYWLYQIRMGNPEYDDYSAPVAGLALINCLVSCELSDVEQSEDDPVRPDAEVKDAFLRQTMREVNEEQFSRLKQGIWRCWYNKTNDSFHYRLTRRRRLSALRLLNNHAQPALLQYVIDQPLDGLSVDDVYHTMASSPEVFCFLTKTDPVGWSKFETEIGSSSFELSAIGGFLVFLDFSAAEVGHSYWYDNAFLVRLWNIYTQFYPQYNTIQANSIIGRLNSFSMTPSKAAEYLIHPPFFKLNGRYLRNPCFLKVQNFTVGLLTIAIRLHEKAWSRTLGSSLAKAADTIISMLPELPRLKVSARRKYPGGDVDVALYDIETQELLVCEVKTVYDKHRTDSLIHRYEEAKINVQKACSQLRETVRAISAGEISMRQLFNTDLPEPQRVHQVLLTWFDPIDVTMGTPEEEVLSMNFATFIWLIRAAQGDVKAMAKSVTELRNLWALSVVRKLDLGQPELNSDLERQTSYLDKRSSLDGLSLSPLTKWIVNELDAADDVDQSGQEEKYVSYLEDTRAILSLAT